MVGDGVTTRTQKEVGQLQQELSKLQTDLDKKLETRLASFQDEFRVELKIVSQDKGKGILGGAPPGFPPNDTTVTAPVGSRSIQGV
ncbi:hypothetical protein CXB51_031192 [Gossypium anomalum]|uniref:Uncharacterized protein n=1 Tax=Gossypium anomalum TaxID=47600 RepID=A0A8J6CGZ0_9ROSI|nr:hypothetical protein CXB51_031192 [Gossypium anomalum]